MKTYKQIVSLGSFCSPAMEFERIGRRQYSLPFDWLITPELKTVTALIENGFDGFLSEDDMAQSKAYPMYYKNQKTNIEFYHDFSPFQSLSSQMPAVTEKYNRRIERFYRVIQEPTLFLRYVARRDVDYLSEHYESVLATLRKFNPENDIIFVVTKGTPALPSALTVYEVEKDEGDGVSREFLKANEALKAYIESCVEAATPKQQKANNPSRVWWKKVYKKVRLMCKLTYRHDNRY